MVLHGYMDDRNLAHGCFFHDGLVVTPHALSSLEVRRAKARLMGKGYGFAVSGNGYECSVACESIFFGYSWGRFNVLNEF